MRASPRGAVLPPWGNPGEGPGRFRNPTGLAVDAAGNLFVCDTGNNRVQQLSPEGKLVAMWGTVGHVATRLDRPLAVAVDGAGNLYVADSDERAIAIVFRLRALHQPIEAA